MAQEYDSLQVKTGNQAVPALVGQTDKAFKRGATYIRLGIDKLPTTPPPWPEHRWM